MACKVTDKGISTLTTTGLKEKGFTKGKSWVEGNNCNNDCYECWKPSDGTYLCKKIECQGEEPTPSDSDSPSEPQTSNFEGDKHLSQLDQPTIDRLKSIWGVSPDTFIKEIDGVLFYATSKDKVYLGSYANDLSLIKDRKEGNEGTNQSTFTVDKLKTMTDNDMRTMLNRVSLIPESKSNMKKILKEEYQKRQNDKEIISKRFNILSESKSADLIISEVDYLQKQKFSSVLIKEALFDLINILYKDDPNAIPKLKDSYKNWLTKKLPNEGDLFTRNLEKSIDNIKNEDVPLLFSDCNKIVELIYSSMIENMVDDNFDVVGVPNDIESIIKKEIIDNLKKDEMKMKIKDQLTNKICPQYGELMRNTEKTFEDLKGKLIS